MRDPVSVAGSSLQHLEKSGAKQLISSFPVKHSAGTNQFCCINPTRPTLIPIVEGHQNSPQYLVMNYNPEDLENVFWPTPYYACFLHSAYIQQRVGKRPTKIEQVLHVSYRVLVGIFSMALPSCHSSKVTCVLCLVQFTAHCCKLSINTASLRVPLHHWKILLLAFEFHIVPTSSF